jgi:hypothetical protein
MRQGIYKEFVKWLDEMVVKEMISITECDGCCVCVGCINNFIYLEESVEESGKDVDVEFMERVEQYMLHKDREKTLEPGNLLDGYCSVLYVEYLKELQIL